MTFGRIALLPGLATSRPHKFQGRIVAWNAYAREVNCGVSSREAAVRQCRYRLSSFVFIILSRLVFIISSMYSSS